MSRLDYMKHMKKRFIVLHPVKAWKWAKAAETSNV